MTPMDFLYMHAPGLIFAVAFAIGGALAIYFGTR